MANDVFGIVGTTVAGAFKVEGVVAEGGFAVVYRAYHSGFRAPVALKCLKIPEHFTAQEQARFERQFQAEAELLFKLSASISTVVRPLHVEAAVAPDGTFMPFLALEWLDGETLDAVAKRRSEQGLGEFALQDLVKLLDPVALALERAHHFTSPDGPVSIVHRDMKPENIFVARVAGERVIKILDFGIAKAESMASQAAARLGHGEAAAAAFTPAYGAPEQWMPKRFGPTGPWTDVWGLALTLVELAAGRPIVDGDQAAMMGAVLDPERRPTPRNEGVEVGDAVESVFERALALSPRDRFRDVGDFWRSLTGALASDAAARIEPLFAPGLVPPKTGALGRHNLIPDLEAPSHVPALQLDATGPVSARGAQRNPSPSAGMPSVRDPARPTDRAPPPPMSGSARASRPPAVAADAAAAVSPRDRASRPPNAPASVQPPAPAGAVPSLRASSGISLDLTDTHTLRSPAPSPRSLPSPPSRTRPRGRFRASDLPARLELYRPFVVPLSMVTSGVLITILDGVYAASSGQVFTLGPMNPGWLAAALVIGGIALGAYRLAVARR